MPDGTDLDEWYYEAQIKVLERQIALTGLRLAKLLNESIGKMTPRDFTTIAPQTVGQETSSASELAGQTRNDIGSGVKVWVNTKSGAFHCPDSRWYGKTKQGKYMSESEAVKNGYHAAGEKSCEFSQ